MNEGEWTDPASYDQTITAARALQTYLDELLDARPGDTIGKSKISCIKRM